MSETKQSPKDTEGELKQDVIMIEGVWLHQYRLRVFGKLCGIQLYNTMLIQARLLHPTKSKKQKVQLTLKKQTNAQYSFKYISINKHHKLYIFLRKQKKDAYKIIGSPRNLQTIDKTMPKAVPSDIQVSSFLNPSPLLPNILPLWYKYIITANWRPLNKKMISQCCCNTM